MTSKMDTSDRKRSRPLTKKKKIDFFKKNKLATGFVILIIIFVSLAAIYFVYIENNNKNENNKDNQNNSSGGHGVNVTNPIAVIDTSKGIIKVELYLDKTPNTVNNFISYVNDGFYNGLVFHRVANLIPDQPDTHIIQGGGFYPDGTQKTTKDPIDLEINEDARHVDGAIAMARTSDPNSATSQFYICDGEHDFLNDNYAVFGVVISGMDVVRSISSVDTETKFGYYENWPVEDIIINSITIE